MNQIPLLGDTRTRIVTLLLEGPRTAGDLSGALRIQVSATRKHLERLRALGIVDEHFERAGPGRPKKVFGLTDEGRELFPRHYDAVLNALVTEIATDHGEPAARRALHRVADGFARAAVPEPGADREALRQLEDGLAELGFEPSVMEKGRDCTITSRNCPILRTAKLHRELVCQSLHGHLIQAATGAEDVQRGRWIVDGDPVCTHTFRRS